MTTPLLKTQPEKLGSFYLGGALDETKSVFAPLHFDARDLTTHGVCIGMTGSGKTGLCVCLLEEAALDQIPAIIIDPKGDMGNLLLHFPDLAPSDYLPWINTVDARRKGLTEDGFAEQVAETWKGGLASWGIDSSRLRSLARAVDFKVFTPGSTAVCPVNVLGRLAAPETRDSEARHQRSLAIGSALLGLVGLDADPSKSRELTFLTVLIEHFWTAGKTPDIATLIRAIPDPPVRQLGVFDIDAFITETQRFELAMRFNTLVASPSFSSWLEGEPLDIESLLFTAEGKARHSVFYIAHLSDEERMFFVTLLLDAIVSWMRAQPGTTSLRALLYFDEVFGYLPPVAQPPSKGPLLTILKQGRAFGLGALLATQNPIDLDYKALSNAGTWFIGRLQSEQDRSRLLSGIPHSADSGGVGLDRAVASLESRAFVLHSVHEDEPVVFRTRWAMNYLRGPLTRSQLALLQPPSARVSAASQHGPASPAISQLSTNRPALPQGLEQAFLAVSPSDTAVLSASLGVEATVRYYDRKRGIDVSEHQVLLASSDAASGPDWDMALSVPGSPALSARPPSAAQYATGLPSFANTRREVASAVRSLKDYLYRNRSLVLKEVPGLDVFQHPDESKEAFYARAQLNARERRDLEIDEFLDKQRDRIERLEDRLRKKEYEIDEKEAALRGRKQEEWIKLGESVLGVLLGSRSRRLSSSVSRRRMTVAAKKRLERVLAEADDLRRDIEELRAESDLERSLIANRWGSAATEFREFVVTPRRSDISVGFAGVIWHPSELAS